MFLWYTNSAYVNIHVYSLYSDFSLKVSTRQDGHLKINTYVFVAKMANRKRGNTAFIWAAKVSGGNVNIQNIFKPD